MSNTLQQLLLKYPYKRWPISTITRNPCITMQFINDNKFEHRYTDMLYNSSITYAEVYLFIHKLTDVNIIDNIEILQNRFGLDEIKVLLSVERLYASLRLIISRLNSIIHYNIIQLTSSNIHMFDIVNIYRTMPWFQLRNLITDEILDISDIELIYVNSSITLDLIEIDSLLKSKINYRYLSANPNLTISYILGHLDEDWNWSYISINHGISLEDIADNPHLSWTYYHMFDHDCRLDLTVDFVEYVSKCKTDEFNMYLLSNISFSINEIKWLIKHVDSKLINMNSLLNNPNIDLKFIEDMSLLDVELAMDKLSSNHFNMNKNYDRAAYYRLYRIEKIKRLQSILKLYLPLVVANIVCEYVMFTNKFLNH